VPSHEATAGRPRTSSRATIEDAAAELFLENGYPATTIGQITQRAGVSRATFFNYFTAKSDLLWVELDAAIESLARELAGRPTGAAPLAAVREAMLRVAAGIGPDRVPLALTQDDVMGTTEETRGSGLVRLARRSEILAGFLARELGRSRDDLIVLSAANAISGAISAAWTVWAKAGISRRPLAHYVDEAFSLVSGGLEAALAANPARP
jgi:AcrR family transcriptional regulator